MSSDAMIRALYAYNRWANARVLDAVSTLTPAQFQHDLGSSFGSVRETLVHMFSAEWVWLQRWQGVSSPAMLDPQEFPAVESVGTWWAAVEREQERFLSTLTPEALTRIVSYRNFRNEQRSYPLGQMLLHAVNHASYHRGQVATLLRQLGQTPLATDLLVFSEETGGEGLYTAPEPGPHSISPPPA